MPSWLCIYGLYDALLSLQVHLSSIPHQYNQPQNHGRLNQYRDPVQNFNLIP